MKTNKQTKKKTQEKNHIIAIDAEKAFDNTQQPL